MSRVPVFHGTVTDDGRLVLTEAETRIRRTYLQRLAGKAVDVVVRVHRNQRSLDQNAWHWGVAIPILADSLGYDKHEHDQLHYALVAKCFGTKRDPILQQEVPLVRSSALTTVQFSELMEWEVRWAAQEHGIVIPLPNESEAA